MSPALGESNTTTVSNIEASPILDLTPANSSRHDQMTDAVQVRVSPFAITLIPTAEAISID